MHLFNCFSLFAAKINMWVISSETVISYFSDEKVDYKRKLTRNVKNKNKLNYEKKK